MWFFLLLLLSYTDCILSAEQQGRPPVSAQLWVPAAPLGQNCVHYDSETYLWQDSGGRTALYIKPNAFPKCISALWVSRKASNAVPTAVLTAK